MLILLEILVSNCVTPMSHCFNYPFVVRGWFIMDFFSCDSFLLLRVIVSFASSESLYTGLFLYRLSYFNFIFSCNRLTFHPSLQNLTDCKHEYSVVIEGVSLVLVLLCLNSTAQLEASLGTFYAPTRPLLDTTILEYRDQISKYARRFFHHLLR